MDSHQYKAIHFVKHAYEILRYIYDHGVYTGDEEVRSTVPTIVAPMPETEQPSGLVGHPKFVIPKTQLLYLIENRFTISRIAKMLGILERTVYRRMAELRYSVTAQYAELTNDDLFALISEIQEEFPMCGNHQMAGNLLSHGFRVQQSRIREAQR